MYQQIIVLHNKLKFILSRNTNLKKKANHKTTVNDQLLKSTDVLTLNE